MRRSGHDWLKSALVSLALLLAPRAHAQAAPPNRATPTPTSTLVVRPHELFLHPSRARNLRFDLPAIDARENLTLGFWPSMRQSLAATEDAYYAVHGAIMSIPYPRIVPYPLVVTLDYALIVVTDVFAMYVPLGDGWMHEEWHRAVMSRRNISSYNDIYDFPFFRELINVSHVKDEDLVRLKARHPADQIRMSAAGIEGDFARAVAYDKDRFFFRTRGATLFAQWMATLNAIAYMNGAAFDSDGPTERLNAEEGANVPVRDFTGLDPNGWVYDLFRPDEPYEARGVHPSGVGLDRYRSGSDLTRRERRYLAAQARLSWLNLADPMLVGVYEIPLGRVAGEPLAANASLGHVMAPFGYSLALNLLAKTGRYAGFAELRANVSEGLVLPGLSAELVRYKLPFLGASITPRARLWLQPTRQRFAAKTATPGAALEARLNLPLARRLETYVELAAKTPGWIQGDVFLDRSLNVRTGFELMAF